MIESIKELFEKSDASGSKSTVLKPLTWFISIIFGSLIILMKINAQKWVIILVSIILCITIVLFLFAYLYCLFKDRDALRSEKYSIQKMAIERGLYGDNFTGLLTTEDTIITSSNAESQNGGKK